VSENGGQPDKSPVGKMVVQGTRILHGHHAAASLPPSARSWCPNNFRDFLDVLRGHTKSFQIEPLYARLNSEGTNKVKAVEMDLRQSGLDEFGHRSGLKFKAEHRQQIVDVLRRFADAWLLHKKMVEDERRRRAREKDYLKKIAKWATKGTRLIDGLQGNYPGAWKRLATDKTDSFRAGLEILRDSSGLLAKRRFHSPPQYPILWKLLISLERIFRDAGGISTGVHCGRKPRHGPFPDFVDFAIKHLPRNIRPGSLNSVWEEFFSGRKAGRNQMLAMSSPGLFDIGFTSRRERRRERRTTRQRPRKTIDKATPVTSR